MTERLMCSNCGGPVTRTGNETSVTCTHCQTVTEFPPVRSASSAADDDEGDNGKRRGRDDGPRDVPAIVIIQTGGGMPQGNVRPIIVQRRSSFPFFVVPIFFVLVSVGISAFIRARAAKLESAIPSAEKAAERAADKGEKAAEKAEKAAEKPPEKKGRH
jgi:hypothetical protein